ncbi:MAG: Sua5/YciO/YrdC/YwlC family protein, partial [Clostridia bacterium]|nr:Sua5/YciO/YrdC/YwlC family protein [Clostridia bacterium]
MEYIKLKDCTEDIINRIKDILKSGGIIIIPTDTVYGFAADASNESAIKKIYDLKAREYSNPMNIL